VPSRKKSCKEENNPPKDQHPERERLDRNASVGFLALNGGVQVLHISCLFVIDTLPIMFS
jgi:hypothetical protein